MRQTLVCLNPKLHSEPNPEPNPEQNPKLNPKLITEHNIFNASNVNVCVVLKPKP